MKISTTIINSVMAMTLLLTAAGCGKSYVQTIGTQEVLVLSGGSFRKLIEEAMERYKKVSDDVIRVTYGDSAEMCVQLQNTGKGDLYCCHDPFMEWAEKRGLIAEWKAVGYLENALIVPKGNPKNIHQFSDLGQPGLRVGVGDQIFSTSGVMIKQMLEKAENGAAISSNIVAETKGHAERVASLLIGSLDAGIVWAPIAKLSADKLEIIPIPPDAVDSVTSPTYGISDLRNIGLTTGLTTVGAKNEAAVRFYKFITEECKDIFANYGLRLEAVAQAAQ